MNPSPLELAATSIPAHPGMSECLQYQSVGLVVVIGALASLWLICELVGMAFRATKVREVHSMGGSDVFDDGGEEPELNAVIVAAVHATLGPGHRIVSAAPAEATPAVKEDATGLRAAIIAAVHVALGPGHRVASVRVIHDASGPAWSAEGRREHFHSHTVR